MKIRINIETCTGCGACVTVCPVDALAVQTKVRLDASRCVNCRMCLTACPLKAITCR